MRIKHGLSLRNVSRRARAEQHGHHIGVGADWIQAEAIAHRVGEQCGALILPTLCYGVSGHHKEFTGTLTLSTEVYADLIYELLESLKVWS